MLVWIMQEVRIRTFEHAFKVCGANAKDSQLHPLDRVPWHFTGELVDKFTVQGRTSRQLQDRIHTDGNSPAGFSGLLNVRPVFWSFGADGEWKVSTSGFLFESYGNWRLDGLQDLQLSRASMEPKQYRARFKDGDLYLTDDKGQFTVLSRCK